MNKRMKILLIIILILFVAFLAFFIAGWNSGLSVVHYSVKSKKNAPEMKIAVISDLHSCKYGENESELIDAIDKENPDIVVMTGDIYDRVLPDDNTDIFLSRVSKKYPCYYVTGNHEYIQGDEIFEKRMEYIKALGIVRLSEECVEYEKNGNFINICGVNDPYSYKDIYTEEEDRNKLFSEKLTNLSERINKNNFTILISHRPEKLNEYVSNGFDLVFCGHAHGGQFRIPGVMNGLFAPHQGLFPKYAGGEYVENRTTMIVSRGLARETVKVPRIYNRPELVIVTIEN